MTVATLSIQDFQVSHLSTCYTFYRFIQFYTKFVTHSPTLQHYAKPYGINHTKIMKLTQKKAWSALVATKHEPHESLQIHNIAVF